MNQKSPTLFDRGRRGRHLPELRRRPHRHGLCRRRGSRGGASALKNIKERVYDVALLDLKLPDMDGLTLYREMK